MESDPDYLIEKFWYGFKDSMSNFYRENDRYYRPINLWSTILNKYKDGRNYDKIQETIYQYIVLHMIDVIRSGKIHKSNILNTYIKRWEALCEKIDFFHFDKEINKVYEIYRIYLKTLEMENNMGRILFTQPELYIFFNNFTPLVKFGIENKKSSIIDRVASITDIGEILYKLYGYEGNTNMSGIKLIHHIHKLT